MINRRSFIGTASLAMMAAGMPFAASAEKKVEAAGGTLAKREADSES